MGDVYSKAVNVIAWLGPEINDSNRPMQFVSTFDEHTAGVLSKVRTLHWGPVSREEYRAGDEDS